MLYPGPTCNAHQRVSSPRTWREPIQHSQPGILSPSGQQCLSIGPLSPTQMSTTASGPAFEGGWFSSCSSIAMTSSTAMQNFLHHHKELVACVHETKLWVNSALKELRGYATISCDCKIETIKWRTCHPCSSLCPLQCAWWWHRYLLPNDNRAEVLAVEANLGVSTLTFVNV